MQSIAFSTGCVSADAVRSRHLFKVPVLFGVGSSGVAVVVDAEDLSFAFGIALVFGTLEMAFELAVEVVGTLELAFEVEVISGC